MRLNQLRKVVEKLPRIQTRNASKCEVKPDPCDCPSTGTNATPKEPEIAEGYKKLKITQLQFQAEDNLPIFLKRPTDKYLFYTTLVLCAFGIIAQLNFFYELVVPPQPTSESDE